MEPRIRVFCGSLSEEYGHRDQRDRAWHLEQDGESGCFRLVEHDSYYHKTTTYPLDGGQDVPAEVREIALAERDRIQASKAELLARPDLPMWLGDVLVSSIGPGDEVLAPRLAALLASPDAGGSLRPGSSTPGRARQALDRIGRGAIPHLMSVLADAKPEVRHEVANYLAGAGHRDQVVTTLLGLAGRESDPARLASTVRGLMPPGDVRSAAAELAEVRPDLAAALFDALLGVIAGRESGYAECVRLFSAALPSDRSVVRKLGCLGLYYLGGRAAAAAPSLARLRADPDPVVRRMAANALSAIGGGAGPGAASGPAGV